MRLWQFHVLLNVDGNVKSDIIEVEAKDSYGAVNALPATTISWDFHAYQDGTYSRPVEERAA